MASYGDLSDFQRGLIVGAREMGYSVSDVEAKFGFSRTTISKVYREYKTSGKPSNQRQKRGRKRTLGEQDQEPSVEKTP